MVLIRQLGAEEILLKADDLVRLSVVKDDKIYTVGLEISRPTTWETVAWVQSVLPEQNRSELDDQGTTEFDFALSELVDNPWIRVAIAGGPGDYRVRAFRRKSTAS